jgi:hypothetical protein
MVLLASMARGNRSRSCPTKYAMRASHTAVVLANVCGWAACPGPRPRTVESTWDRTIWIARSSSSLLVDKAVCAVRRCAPLQCSKDIVGPQRLLEGVHVSTSISWKYRDSRVNEANSCSSCDLHVLSFSAEHVRFSMPPVDSRLRHAFHY